ncbi:DUF4129 domain-containing protein [Pseudomonas sp. 3A(2025)]
MHLTEASIALRPRPAWEALDLGILLAREHRSLLMTSWALITLPLLALLSLLLWDYPGVVLLLFWWLKPLYERLPLLILSRAVFGATPTLKQALKAWPSTLRSQWLPSLLARRLSLVRSFTLPVQQLEGLSGAERAQRLGVLCQADMRAARCLTLTGMHLEMVLSIGLIMLLYLLVPRQLEHDLDWLGLLQGSQQMRWVDHLLNLLYALVLIVWEPLYVACGFTLYLNRRTRLEAWDIELVFRRLRQRLANTAASLLLGTTLMLACLPSSSWAASVDHEAGPDSPRLTHQPLDSQQSRQAIEQVLDKPPFKNPQSVSGWRLAEDDPPTEASGKQSAAPDWLNRLLEGASLIARLIEVLLWGLAISLLVLLVWRYRQWLQLFVTPLRKRKPVACAAPQQLFGLEVSAESLPDDVATSVQTLWASQPREALGLLYRALLSRLISNYQLPLSPADTEGQVLERIARLNLAALSTFSEELTGHWQNLAYGHRLPAADVQQRLCEGWRQLFDSEARA